MDQSSLLAIIVSVVAILLAITVHEFSHGFIAFLQGDRTAQDEGRLTLNPIAHIDPVGTILIPGLLILTGAPFLIGWAKPVPYNPNNLRDGRFGSFLVALAGPVSNFFMALVSALVLKALFPALGAENFLIIFLLQLFLVNLVLGIFNLIPVPPLDGSKILFNLLPPSFDRIALWFEAYGFYILIAILVFGQGAISSVVRAGVAVIARVLDLPL